jgi:hypothetical protein
MVPEDWERGDGAGDELVRFLLRETGDRLFFVLQYDAESWRTLYLSSVAEQLLAETSDDEVREMLDGFCRMGRTNVRLESAFDVGEFYCSLHLFGGLVTIHFFQPDDDGVIFGFDPAVASHLTDFVSMTIPYVRRVGLDDLGEAPAWESD